MRSSRRRVVPVQPSARAPDGAVDDRERYPRFAQVASAEKNGQPPNETAFEQRFADI